MATIPLTGGFTPIPEGTHVFRINSIEYKESFGKLKINMSTKEDKKHTERFSLENKDGSPNDGALSAFSFFAKTALDDFTLVEIDPESLVGRFIEAEVTHTVEPSTTREGETVTFIKLGRKSPAHGFEKVSESVQESPPTTSAGDFDLDSLLGL